MPLPDSLLTSLLTFLHLQPSDETYESTMIELLDNSVYDHLASDISNQLAEVYYLTLSIAAYKFLNEEEEIPTPIDPANFVINNSPEIDTATGRQRNFVSLAYVDAVGEEKYHVLSGDWAENVEGAVRNFLEVVERVAVEYESGEWIV